MIGYRSSKNKLNSLIDVVVNGEKIEHSYGEFVWSKNFDSTYEVTIGSNVKNCAHMFSSSYWNCPVTISNGVINCSNMFAGGVYSNFTTITIPSSVTDCSNMFNGVGMIARYSNFDAYFKGTGPINTTAMFSNTSSLINFRVNVYFNSARNQYFNMTENSIVAGLPIEWTDMDNGFYNEACDIYCYNNYPAE